MGGQNGRTTSSSLPLLPPASSTRRPKMRVARSAEGTVWIQTEIGLNPPASSNYQTDKAKSMQRQAEIRVNMCFPQTITTID